MIKKGVTIRKQIHNGLIALLVLVLTMVFINYFKNPDELYSIDSYLPSIIGWAIGWGVVLFFQYRKNGGDLNAKLTDERDEQLGHKYSAFMSPILLFYIPLVFLLYAIATHTETVSVMTLSIILYIYFLIYGIGFLIYRNINS